MPITPRFTLSQTDEYIHIDISVPHVRVSTDSVQVVLTDGPSLLHFASPPYLLRLNFAPHIFAEQAEEGCATYQPTMRNGVIALQLRKAVAKYWPHLDLVGNLILPLQPRRRTTTSSRSGNHSESATSSNPTWLREIISSSKSTFQLEDADAHEHDDDIECNDIHNDKDKESGSDIHNRADTRRSRLGYGFLRMHHDIYTDLVRDGMAREMLLQTWDYNDHERPLIAIDHDNDDDDWEDTVYCQRRLERHEQEYNAFSSQRYLQDQDMDDDYIYQCAMSMQPHWQMQDSAVDNTVNSNETSVESDDTIHSLIQGVNNLQVEESSKSTLSLSPSSSKIREEFNYFTADEHLQLTTIPYPLLPTQITREQHQSLIRVVLDLLFAYVYDHLTTQGDPTVESAWTVTTLSATLSCLEDWNQPNDQVSTVVYSSLRRALIYPYVRNVSFGMYVWQQVVRMIRQGGVRGIIRSLLQMRHLLDHSELYYLCNKVWVDPLLAWIQAYATLLGSTGWTRVAQEIEDILHSTHMDDMKEHLDLNLTQVESAACCDSNSESGESSMSLDESQELESNTSDDENTNNVSSNQNTEKLDAPVASSDLLSMETALSSSSGSIDTDGLATLLAVDHHTLVHPVIPHSLQEKPRKLIEELK
jgi:protein SHQ1